MLVGWGYCCLAHLLARATCAHCFLHCLLSFLLFLLLLSRCVCAKANMRSAAHVPVPPPFPLPELWPAISKDVQGRQFCRRWLNSPQSCAGAVSREHAPPHTHGGSVATHWSAHPLPGSGAGFSLCSTTDSLLGSRVAMPSSAAEGPAPQAPSHGTSTSDAEQAPEHRAASSSSAGADFVTLDLNEMCWDESKAHAEPNPPPPAGAPLELCMNEEWVVRFAATVARREARTSCCLTTCMRTVWGITRARACVCVSVCVYVCDAMTRATEAKGAGPCSQTSRCCCCTPVTRFTGRHHAEVRPGRGRTRHLSHGGGVESPVQRQSVFWGWCCAEAAVTIAGEATT